MRQWTVSGRTQTRSVGEGVAMAKFIRWLPLLLLIVAQSTFAMTCTFKGQKFAVIEFNVTGSPGVLQKATFQETGNNPLKTLWYTENSVSDSHYFFNDHTLQEGTRYKIRILNEASGTIPSRYYRKNLDSNVNSWTLVSSMIMEMKPGNITVEAADDSELTCKAVEPEDIEDYIPPTFGQCEYFPQAIQSWKTEGTVYSSYGPSSFTANNATENILGWSDNYVNDPQNIFRYEPWWGAGEREALRIGFDTTQNSNTYYANCQGYGCGTKSLHVTFDGADYDIDDGYFEDRKAETPEPLNVSFDSIDDLYIQVNDSASDFSSFCNNNGLCSYSDSGSHFELTILKNLKSLTVENVRSDNKKLNVHLSPGLKIETFSVNGNTAVYFGEDDAVLLGTASIGEWGDTQIYLGSDSVISIAGDGNDETSDLTTGVIQFIPISPSDGSSDYQKPLFYGPAANYHIKASGVIEAYLLAKSMNFDVGISIKGSITAHNLNVVGNITVTRDSTDPECWNEPDTDKSYSLILQPKSDIALVCQTLEPELSVFSDGVLATDFTGTVVVTVDGVTTPYSVTNGSFNLPLTLSTTASKTIQISAYIDGDEANNSVSGSYEFVPYKLSVDPQYVIANKPIQISASALACDDDGGVVDLGYNGSPTIQSSWVAPSTGTGSLSYAPVFISGQSSSELTLEESGEYLVTMTDEDFSCSGDYCPIEGETLKGQFTVYSRPWTFAICSANNSAMNGNITDSSSSAFTSAGNAFELYIRPLRWVEGGYDSDPVTGSQDIETSAYCSSPVTQNFFSSDSSLTANVELTHQVSQPSGGADGSLSGTLVHSNTEGTNSSYLPFSELSWSEVGVLRVNADTQADYLGMNVNLGYRDIGRFYPAWLSLVSNEWNYADDHDGFMYMDQPVSYDFTVEAQNLQGGATTNYSEFASDLISNVKLLAVDTENGNEELSDRVEDYSSQLWDSNSDWSGAQLQIEEQDFEFTRSQSSSSPLTTTADGPYTDGFGLRVTTKVDGVDFNTSQGTNLELNSSGTLVDTGKPFPTEQPDIRYGRMVMDDVGGTSVSTIRIPLRTEYWNGSRFITNNDDSGSHFVTLNSYICKQSVWSATGDASNATLQGSSTLPGENVDDGISQALSAAPHSTVDSSSLREQIRFWLRLDDSNTTSPQISESGVTCGSSYTSQPWLQYNWRSLGDEDPSSVVTFGIHRGNDRIIFRGETNLTGQ